MNRRSSPGLSKILVVHSLLVFLALPGSVLGFCVDLQSRGLEAWKIGGSKFGQRIPVWIVSSGRYSVIDDPAKPDGSFGIGMSKNEIIADVKAVVRLWNESIVGVHLEYAGEVGSDSIKRWRTDPPPIATPGIVIGSARGPNIGGARCSSQGECGGMIFIGSPGDDQRFGREPFTEQQPTGFFSLRSVLLHEAAHVFGLNHLHQVCDPDFVTTDPNHEDGPSAYHSVLNFQLQNPRRDEMEGVLHQFGYNNRVLAILSSSSGMPGTWTTPVPTQEKLTSKVPPAISQPGVMSAIAGTSGSDQLWFAVDSTGNGYGPRRYIYDLYDPSCDPSDNDPPCDWENNWSKTVYRPAIATGDGQVAVAWLEETDKEIPDVHLRVMFHEPGSDSAKVWLLNLVGATGWFHDLGLGYEGASDRFLLTARDIDDGLPHLWVLDHRASGNIFQMVEQEIELGGDHVLNLGRTVCRQPEGEGLIDLRPSPVVDPDRSSRRFRPQRSNCITVMTGAQQGMSFLAFARGTMLEGNFEFFGRHIINETSSGRVDLAWIGATLVGTSADGGTAGARVFRSQIDFPFFPDGEEIATDHWPIAVGGLERRLSWCLSNGLGLRCARAEFRIVVPVSDSR